MLFDMGVLSLNQIFSATHGKNEKFECPSERGGPEDIKNCPTFVSM